MDKWIRLHMDELLLIMDKGDKRQKVVVAETYQRSRDDDDDEDGKEGAGKIKKEDGKTEG